MPRPDDAPSRRETFQLISAAAAATAFVPSAAGAQTASITPAAGDVSLVERMLEVQTIISRTYAVSHLGRHAQEGFDLCSTTHCQLYDPQRLQTSKWAVASSEATRQTSGTIATRARINQRERESLRTRTPGVGA